MAESYPKLVTAAEMPAFPGPIPVQREVTTGGGGPYDGGLQVLIARVDGLDKRMDKFETALGAMDGRIRNVEMGVARLEGKLDLIAGKILSWWQPPLSATLLLAVMISAITLAERLHILK